MLAVKYKHKKVIFCRSLGLVIKETTSDTLGAPGLTFYDPKESPGEGVGIIMTHLKT